MRLPVCGLIAGALLALAGPAAADDFDTCYEATGDVAIAACDRAIASGRYSGTKLSQLYNNRGAEYRKKAEYGRAVADSSEAIRLDPNNAPAYAQRGTAYYKAGQYDPAIADFGQAIRQDPQYAFALYLRGLAKRKQGDAAGGDADIAAAKAIHADIPAVIRRFVGD